MAKTKEKYVYRGYYLEGDEVVAPSGERYALETATIGDFNGQPDGETIEIVYIQWGNRKLAANDREAAVREVADREKSRPSH